MTNFYTEELQAHAQFHTTDRVNDLNMLEPTTREAVTNIIAHARGMGITLIATETYRSCERQALLYAQHSTELKTVGVHHYGLACDFCKIENGKASWQGDWSFLGNIAKLYGMVWGGDWNEAQPGSFRDWDHVQRINVADQPKLFNGSWYPDAPYKPRFMQVSDPAPASDATFARNPGTTFQEGMSGSFVKRIQMALVMSGAHITEDGQYGPWTKNAVAKFQVANRLFASGVCDPVTLKALGL